MNDNKNRIYLNDENRLYMNILIRKSNNIDCKYINYLEFTNLQNLKNRVFDSNNWDKVKKFSNDYELIHIPNKKTRSDSIALYQPLSRSYFKMVEIIQEFDLLNIKDQDFKSSHLAEGPGGFLEAIHNLSHKKGFKNYKHYGITLYSSNKDIPGWIKALDFIKYNKDIEISYGNDKTGNLYKSNNIYSFKNQVGKGSCNIVTGDGGFDYSLDYNKQEQLSYRLILCEIITCLYIQKIGGSFVCKIFDTYTMATIKLLYFLACFYDEFYIYKPLTSRPANSEKYVICKGFRGIDYKYLDNLLSVIKLWEDNDEHIYINDIFECEIPFSFIKQIKNFNKDNSNEQIKTINKAIQLNRGKNNLSALSKIIDKQVQKATEWCNKYNQPINNKSNFIRNKNY